MPNGERYIPEGTLMYKIQVVTEHGPIAYLSDMPPEFLNLKNGRVQIKWKSGLPVYYFFDCEQSCKNQDLWEKAPNGLLILTAASDQIKIFDYIHI